MRDIIGKYNRNRKIIWIIIGICVAIYAIIHLINNSLRNDAIGKEKNTDSVRNEIFYKTNYSVMSDNLINSNINEDNTEIINDFIKYCNESDIDEAYNILSDECKEVLYPSKEEFDSKFLKTNFKERKTYKLQLWTEDDARFTYRVELMSDILATGGILNNKKIDYYTVFKDGEDLKLNVSGLVEKEELNIEKESEIIKINVKSIEKYIEYSFFNIEVLNKTNNRLLLDRGKKGDSVYAVDSKNNAYSSFLFETTDDDLLIEKNTKKDFSIKFQKTYDKDIIFKQIAFTDIVTNFGKKEESVNQRLIIELAK